MPEEHLSNSWNLEAAHPHRLGSASVAGAAIAGAAYAATRGPAFATGVALPLLGATAAWLHRKARSPGTRDRVADLLRTLENRDRYTASHCSRVAAFADLIAEEMELLNPRRLRNLRIAALLHDLGKLDVPLDILHKPGSLDDEEWKAMRGHVLAGKARASCLRRSVCRIIAEHHERPDGRGYPRQLRGDQICLEARIVAVADAFDAMTSDRPYREALDPAVAMAELLRSSEPGPKGQQFDPDVVRALERRYAEASELCTPQLAAQSSPAA